MLFSDRCSRKDSPDYLITVWGFYASKVKAEMCPPEGAQVVRTSLEAGPQPGVQFQKGQWISLCFRIKRSTTSKKTQPAPSRAQVIYIGWRVCFIAYKLSLDILRYTCSKGFNLCQEEQCWLYLASTKHLSGTDPVWGTCVFRTQSPPHPGPPQRTWNFDSDSQLLCSVPFTHSSDTDRED